MEQLSPKLIDYLLNLASTSEYGPALVLAFSLLFMLVYILKTSSPVTVVDEDTSPVSASTPDPPDAIPVDEKYEILYEKLLDAQSSAQDYYNTTVRLRDENLELHERIHDLTQKLPLNYRSLDDDDDDESET